MSLLSKNTVVSSSRIVLVDENLLGFSNIVLHLCSLNVNCHPMLLKMTVWGTKKKKLQSFT